jgi:drug/metabolite transporter (DMT)-like permease
MQRKASADTCCSCVSAVQVLALQHVGSVEAAFVYTLEPVAGAALAYMWLGERWGVSGWFGAALIIASNVVTQVYGTMDDHHHPQHHTPSEVPSLDKE